MSKTNRERAESFLIGASSDDGWIDASSEYAKRRLTELLDEVQREAREGKRTDHGNLDIESGLLDD